MTSNEYQGLLWGVVTDREQDNFADLFGYRQIDDHSQFVLSDEGEKATENHWHLWDGFRDVEHGAQTYEGDPAAHWMGAPVACTTAPLSHYTERRGDFGADHRIERAREVWAKFRAHCLKEANYDPGEGVLLVVRDGF